MDDQFKRPINAKKRVLEPTASNNREHEPERERTKRVKVDRQGDQDYIRKWTRAFRNIVLYFDKPPENGIKGDIVQMAVKLGASVDDFFSNKVTHVITSREIPKAATDSTSSTKENKPKVLSRQATPTYGDEAVTGSAAYTVVDPLNHTQHSIVDTQPKNPFLGPIQQADDLLLRAQEFKIKVWSYPKIYNILRHLLANDTGGNPLSHSQTQAHAHVHSHSHSHATAREQSLKAMLKREKLQGTTERDRSVRQIDQYYFPRNVRYVLVEDASETHRPVLIQEYAVPRANEEAAWPILFACRDERNPFTKYYQNEAPFDGRVYASKGWGMQEHVNYVVEAQLARLCKQGVITMVGSGQHGEQEMELEQDMEVDQHHHQAQLQMQMQLQEDVDKNQNLIQSHSHSRQKDKAEDAYAAASGNSVTITSTNATSQAQAARVPGQRDKRVLQLDKRTTEHRPKTAQANAQARANANARSREADANAIANETAVASTSTSTSASASASANTTLSTPTTTNTTTRTTPRRVSDHSHAPAHKSFAQLLQHRRSSRGKAVVEDSSKPTNAAQALLRAREHNKFEESVAALKNRGAHDVVDDNFDSANYSANESVISSAPTPPPKDILATKEARAAFKEVLPRRKVPTTKPPKEHTQSGKTTQTAQTNDLIAPKTQHTQQKETAQSKEENKQVDKQVDAQVSQETVDMYNHMEKLQAKQKHKEKLSKRQENFKPGYCEICRVKFEDFDRHINTSTHQKKATDPKIWSSLDSLLTQTARPPAKDLPPIPVSPPSPPKKVNMLKRLEKNEDDVAHEELEEMILNPHVPVNVESTYIQNSQPTTVATTQTMSQSQSQTQSQTHSQSSKKSAENAAVSYLENVAEFTEQKDGDVAEPEQVDGGVIDCLYSHQVHQAHQQPPQVDTYKPNNYQQERDAGYYHGYDDLSEFSAEQYQLQKQIADYDVEAEWNAIQDIINPPTNINNNTTNNNTHAHAHELDLPRPITHESITRQDILSLIDDDGRTVQVYDDGDGYVEEDQLEDGHAHDDGKFKVASPEMAEAPRSFSVFEAPQPPPLTRSGGKIDFVHTLTEAFRQMSDSNDHQQHSQSHQSSSHSLVEQPLY
ncbi:hypothetical protein E3P78_02302 [Wallemia ichthyophaga]|nr:hypothetical protein E3P78_02302 [Wallemia ichthyophaga]